MTRLPALPPRRRNGRMVPHEPQPGYWLVREGRRTPPMPASIRRISHEPDNPQNMLSTGPILIANVGWQDADPQTVWTMRRVKTLTRAQYEFHMARVSWIRDYAFDEPEAQPGKPVDLATLKPIGPTE